jgi:HK97 gp10 family phage protein
VIEYQVETLGLDRLLGGLAAAPEVLRLEELKAITQATFAVEAAAKNEAPVRTGRLRSSIHSDVHETATGAEGRVGTTVSYATTVELGTKSEYPITAHKTALMIPISSSAGVFGGGKLSGGARSGQQVAFFHRVKHPKTEGRFFMRHALEETRPLIQGIFTAAAQRVLATIKGI